MIAESASAVAVLAARRAHQGDPLDATTLQNKIGEHRIPLSLVTSPAGQQ